MATLQSKSVKGLLLYENSPLIIITLTILVPLSVFLRRQHNKNRKNFPPSPPKLPIIGNLHQLILSKHELLYRSLQVLSEKYGPIMLLHLGMAPTLVVSSAEMAEEIVKHHDIAFSNRPNMTAAKYLTYGGTDLVFAPYGEYWRQAREICRSHLLSHKRVVESLRSVREEEVASLIHRIRCASSKGNSVNLSEMMFGTTHSILCRYITGKKKGGEGDHVKFLELSKNVVRVFSELSFGDLFPNFMGWMDVLTGLVGRMKATSNEIDAFLDSLIQEKKATLHNDLVDQDFVQILLRLQLQGQLGFTHDNLKAILTDIIVGSLDGVGATMEWVMAELLKNPRVMKKAQEEVRRVVGRKGKVEGEDVNQMEYLRCIVKETLRLHPTSPLMLPRATYESIKLKGYDILANTRLVVNLWAIQRDPKLWDEPQVFLPERFENNPINFVGQDFKYIPFGIGRRGCPGMSFVLVLVEYAIANLLYSFDWKLLGDNAADHGTLDMTEVFGVVVFKKMPLLLVPIVFSP